MAFVAAKSAAAYVNGRDLTSYTRSFSVDASATLPETTTLAKTTRTRIGSLEDAIVQIGGLCDSAADAIEETLANALGGASSLWYVAPAGDADGNVAKLLDCVESQYDIRSDVEGVVEVNAGGASTVGSESGIVLHAKAQETASGSGTTHDAGAATTAGGSAQWHVFSATGLTSIDCDIKGSATGAFAGEETVIASFTQVTSAPASERITWTGATARYIRAYFTLVGTNVTFAVAYYRG